MTLTSVQYSVKQAEYNVSLSVNSVSQRHVMMYRQIVRQAEQASHTVQRYIECRQHFEDAMCTMKGI